MIIGEIIVGAMIISVPLGGLLFAVHTKRKAMSKLS